MTVTERIEALRIAMEDAGVDMYLVPSDDDHASEYVNDHFKFREWITGFTGSAGTALFTLDKAYLWTDGRYFLQAADELKGSGIELMKMGEPDVPTIQGKLRELAQNHIGSSEPVLGFSGDTMTAKEGDNLRRSCKVSVRCDKDLADAIWKDRPELTASEIWEFPLTSCGKTRDEKLKDVREKMAERKADVLLISDLMETAWLLNLRGSDIQNTPVFYSYTIVTAKDCFLFTLDNALSDDLRKKLNESGITCMRYDETQSMLEKLCGNGTTLWADRGKTSFSLISAVAPYEVQSEDAAETNNSETILIDEPTPVEMMKAIKNETEIQSTLKAHLKDGVAVTKFIYWLKNQVKELCASEDGFTSYGKLTEISCADKLEEFRREQDGLFDLSFPTISGYNENGAIIHYEPTPETDAVLKPEGFLLVDSGGQYIDGTTDITRTIALGPITDKMKEYYTLVLKGHIALGSAEFKEGTTGIDLDKLARKPLQDHGLDFNHGTGHGVGHVLSVHEGPNRISTRGSDTPILPGMITSNEPGVYIEGEFGIRLESEILCERAAEGGTVAESAATESDARAANDMLHFHTLTLAPFDRDAIVPEMLTKKELSWLNSYHESVLNSLMPYLEPEEAKWLRRETAPF